MQKNDMVSNKNLKILAEDVLRLSRLLTRDREDLPADYLRDERLRKAYLAYFLPANLSKIHKPLQELLLHPGGSLLVKEKLRILDIGAGPGTAMLGILDFFSRREQRPLLEFLAIDQVAHNLKDAEELFRTFRQTKGLEASLKTVQSEIENLSRAPGHFDIIVLSNVLNELFAHDEKKNEKRTGFLTDILCRYLAVDGSCIIIEPALRETSRDLLEVRDALIGNGFHVYSPCLQRGKCPALENPRDWCYVEVPWNPTPLVRELDMLTGLRKDSLKFSYFVLRKDTYSFSDIHGAKDYRVVSEPLVTKGKVEFYICGNGGRKLITRLDRDASALNSDYEKLRRGFVATFERLIDEGKRYKVEKDTAVSLSLI